MRKEFIYKTITNFLKELDKDIKLCEDNPFLEKALDALLEVHRELSSLRNKYKKV